MLPTPADEPHVVEELRRREHGPICAQCTHSPLDEGHLPKLRVTDSPPVTNRDMVRSFHCERRGRQCSADSGYGCPHFHRRVR